MAWSIRLIVSTLGGTVLGSVPENDALAGLASTIDSMASVLCGRDPDMPVKKSYQYDLPT